MDQRSGRYPLVGCFRLRTSAVDRRVEWGTRCWGGIPRQGAIVEYGTFGLVRVNGSTFDSRLWSSRKTRAVHCGWPAEVVLLSLPYCSRCPMSLIPGTLFHFRLHSDSVKMLRDSR